MRECRRVPRRDVGAEPGVHDSRGTSSYASRQGTLEPLGQALVASPYVRRIVDEDRALEERADQIQIQLGALGCRFRDPVQFVGPGPRPPYVV